MKTLRAMLCCGILAAGSLTGCMRSDVYETEHFTFSVSSEWHLEQAEYNENTKKNDYLRFEQENRDGCFIREHMTDLSVSDLAAQFGEAELLELSGCRYPAWQSVRVSTEKGQDDVTIGATVYIDAGDCILRIAANHPHGMNQPFDLAKFEDTLQPLLSTLTLQTEES